MIQINLEHDTIEVWNLARSWSISTTKKWFSKDVACSNSDLKSNRIAKSQRMSRENGTTSFKLPPHFAVAVTFTWIQNSFSNVHLYGFVVSFFLFSCFWYFWAKPIFTQLTLQKNASCDLVTFTEKILNGKLHFLCSFSSIIFTLSLGANLFQVDKKDTRSTLIPLSNYPFKSKHTTNTLQDLLTLFYCF